MNRFPVDFIRQLVERERLSVAEVCDELKTIALANGEDTLGLSKSSLEKFMRKHDIGQHRLSADEFDELVADSIQVVGKAVGVRLMTGMIRSKYGYSASKEYVRKSMRRVDPEGAEGRKVRIGRLIRPGVYHGRYFGYNMHMDQNEKLNMFGVTFVIAVDGHSSCIVGAATMVRKNNIVIYEKIFRQSCLSYGLWDRVLVDHGQEFILTLYMQQDLHYRMRYKQHDELESTYRQMRSVKNTRVERMWVYVNRLVSYPIKACVADLFRRNVLDTACDHHLFSVGEVVRPVAEFGLTNTVGMWNNHTIQGHGKPIDYIQLSQTKAVRWDLLIDGKSAADEYRRIGGSIRDEYGPMGDILDRYPELKGQRDDLYWHTLLPQLHRSVVAGRVRFIPRHFAASFAHKSVIEMLYGSCCNKIYWPLQEAVLLYIQISVALYNRRVNVR